MYATATFTLPLDEVDPGEATQALDLDDLTVMIDGQVADADDFSGTPVANYAFGIFMGIGVTITDSIPSPFASVEVANGTVTGYDGPPHTTASVLYDLADTQATFTLSDDTAGAISYDIAWDDIDPDEASQSLPLSNFKLSMAGQIITEANADFITSPTGEFEYGALVGFTFDIDTSAISGFPYTGISMGGDFTLSAQPPPEGLPPVVPPPHIADVNARATIILDFATAATGQSYRIDLVVKNAAGTTLVSTSVTIGAGATTEDIRDGIASVLGNSGLDIVPMGTTKLRLASKGDTKLGAITYDTFVNAQPASLAGPGIAFVAGTASLSVNGM